MDLTLALSFTGVTLLGLALISGLIAVGTDGERLHRAMTGVGVTSLALAVASFLAAIWTNLAV